MYDLYFDSSVLLNIIIYGQKEKNGAIREIT